MFARMLPTLYRRLGGLATYASASGDQPRDVLVIHDLHGGAMLDGGHIGADPSLRVQAADFPAGVARGDFFKVAGVDWKAREAGMPILDGAELQVPLTKAER